MTAMWPQRRPTRSRGPAVHLFRLTPTKGTNRNGVSARAIVQPHRGSPRQNVCQKSDSIPVTEYRKRSKAVNNRVESEVARIARPRSQEVDTSIHPTTRSQSAHSVSYLHQRESGRS